MKLMCRCLSAAVFSALLMLAACPEEEEKVEKDPVLTETQEDIAHAPRRTIDHAKRVSDKAEAAAAKRGAAALEAAEE